MTQVEHDVVRRISDDDLEQWRALGYVVVEGVLDAAELEAARHDLAVRVPTFDDVTAGKELPPYLEPFPYYMPGLDHIAVHPTLIDFAERALGSGVVLSHSEMLHKYAGTRDFEQTLHQDYGNNTLAIPSLTDPCQLASITFLTDAPLDMGPTGVVSIPDGTPWSHQRDWSREAAPGLYELEKKQAIPAGATLLYTMRTFHRGTAITATEGSRHSLHVAMQRSTDTWSGWRSLAQRADRTETQTLMAGLSPSQRSALGFPAPGHVFWTAETIEANQRLYPGIDFTPYVP